MHTYRHLRCNINSFEHFAGMVPIYARTLLGHFWIILNGLLDTPYGLVSIMWTSRMIKPVIPKLPHIGSKVSSKIKSRSKKIVLK